MKYFKKIILSTTIFFLLANTVFAVEKPQRYMPYPIVFVSGITTKSIEKKDIKGSPSHDWPNTWLFQQFKPYFTSGFMNKELDKYGSGAKTQLGEIPNMEFFFYDARQAPISEQAEKLRKEIINILYGPKPGMGYYDENAYTYTDPCPKPKVILLCHSYGGLIARYMLANYSDIRENVATVFFIGTPQEGSPLSVVGYFLPKEIPVLKEDLDNLDEITKGSNPIAKKVYANIKKKIKSKITGNLKFMIWAENDESKGGYLYTSTRDTADTEAIKTAIAGNNKWEKLFNRLPNVTQKGTLKATLIDDSLANEYRHTFITHYYSNNAQYGMEKVMLERAVPSKGALSYDLLEAGTHGLSTDLGKDLKKYAIVGTVTPTLKEGLIAKANWYMGFDNFNRYDYSCINNGFWEDGDGVVNISSQNLIGAASAIPAIHASIPLPLGGPVPHPISIGETDHPSTPAIILQAIDDKPVIEDVRIVSLLRPDYGYDYESAVNKVHRIDKTYIIVKATDYLLADIEFETNIKAENLSGYLDPPTNTYKPYFKFGKDFLKERTELIKDSNGAEFPLKLHPGEFYLEVKYSLSGNAWIRLKNPAGKETECEIYRPIAIPYIQRSGLSLSSWQGFNEPPDWQPLPTYSDNRWAAYNSFLTMPEDLRSGGYFGIHLYGSCGYSDAGRSNQRFAYISMRYVGFVAFNLNITDKKIKSAKFAGNVSKELEGGGGDFKVSLLRDTSNSWPITLNSTGDKLLFEVDTLSYKDKDSLEAMIDPTDLNLGGYNVWQIKSDIPIPLSSEDNIIPAGIPNEEVLRNVEVRYQRSFYVGNPLLIVIYE